MPTNGYDLKPYDIDPRRWERCRRDAAAAMLAAGWNKHARKFNEVQMRKALKLWGAP